MYPKLGEEVVYYEIHTLTYKAAVMSQNSSDFGVRHNIGYVHLSKLFTRSKPWVHHLTKVNNQDYHNGVKSYDVVVINTRSELIMAPPLCQLRKNRQVTDHVFHHLHNAAHGTYFAELFWKLKFLARNTE
jgi:hypothetical protein